MSEWYYMAILQLTHVKGSKPDPAYVSKTFGIEVELAKDAIDRPVFVLKANEDMSLCR